MTTTNSLFNLGHKIYYWRTANQTEVDFVLYGEKGLFAFEIKRTGKISTNMFNGLKSFLKEYPFAKAYFVYGGTRELYIDNITVLPFEKCLKELKTILSNL